MSFVDKILYKNAGLPRRLLLGLGEDYWENTKTKTMILISEKVGVYAEVNRIP